MFYHKFVQRFAGIDAMEPIEPRIISMIAGFLIIHEYKGDPRMRIRIQRYPRGCIRLQQDPSPRIQTV